MATERLSMRKAKEILRQKWLGRSHRAIAASVGVGVGSVSEVAGRAQAAGLPTWDAIDALDEAALEARLHPHARASGRARCPTRYICTPSCTGRA